MNKKELEAMAEAYVCQDRFKKEPYYWEHESFIQYAMREAYRTGFLAGRDAAAEIVKPILNNEGYTITGGSTAYDKIKALGDG